MNYFDILPSELIYILFKYINTADTNNFIEILGNEYINTKTIIYNNYPYIYRKLNESNIEKIYNTRKFCGTNYYEYLYNILHKLNYQYLKNGHIIQSELLNIFDLLKNENTNRINYFIYYFIFFDILTLRYGRYKEILVKNNIVLNNYQLNNFNTLLFYILEYKADINLYNLIMHPNTHILSEEITYNDDSYIDLIKKMPINIKDSYNFLYIHTQKSTISDYRESKMLILYYITFNNNNITDDIKDMILHNIETRNKNNKRYDIT
jgi:hypothetical protein